MRLEATRENKPFTERIAIFTRYIEPFKQMWPFYWLKVSAIRKRQRGSCATFRWSDAGASTSPSKNSGTRRTALSWLLASRSMRIPLGVLLVSLQMSGTLEPVPGVIIEATPEPDTTYPTVSYWQDSLPFPRQSKT